MSFQNIPFHIPLNTIKHEIHYFLDGNLNINHPCNSYRLFSLRRTRSYTRKMSPMKLKLMLKSLALGQSLPSLSSARCSCWLMLFMDGKQFKERTQTYYLPSLVPSYSSPLEVFHQHYTNQLNSINMNNINYKALDSSCV